MPVAQILQSMDATVTVCHSRTPCLERLVKEADIVVAALGKPEYVRSALSGMSLCQTSEAILLEPCATHLWQRQNTQDLIAFVRICSHSNLALRRRAKGYKKRTAARQASPA
ncbi:folD [Symbiodinium pilosum]|uniref:methenyltetrahydrofolate cyclohydrolase n=1 Tax=Symbiodinium pilosum TaxID=2952 RepID=A0A812MST2_SYMPI|nr:folD [Symbiodinium pilosum]